MAARVVEDAVVRSEVVAIRYEDRDGKTTTREVEPIALIGWGQAWYLVGHCRLRDGQRAFRLDRIRAARLTGERAPDRGEPRLDSIPVRLRRLALLE